MEGGATEDDVRAAALQYVRKVSGYRRPSRANARAFDEAVNEIADASRRLLDLVDSGTASPTADERRPAAEAAR